MSVYDDTLKGLAGVIKSGTQPKTQAYDTPATVRRVEDGVAYVHIEGGVDETPVSLSIDAKPGDTVMLRVSGGRGWIIGNATAPPTDDTVAKQAKEKVDETAQALNIVSEVANEARDTAKEGKAIAEATNQYFWTDTNGAHVALTPKDTDPNGATGFNSLWNMLGLLLRNGGNILAQFGQNGIAFYDGNGNNAANVLASFGSSGMRVGKSGQTNIQIAPTNVLMTAPDGSVALKVLFERHFIEGGLYEYGARITDENNMSTISITPATNSDGDAFTNKLDYNAIMDSFAWQVTGAGFSLTDKGFAVHVGTDNVAMDTVDDITTITINGQSPIYYDDVPVTVSYAAGTIGTRGGTYSLGTTVMDGYTYIGAYIVDHRNTSLFNASVVGNIPNNTAHLAVYRATGNAVTDAEVIVRKVWASDRTVT